MRFYLWKKTRPDWRAIWLYCAGVSQAGPGACPRAAAARAGPQGAWPGSLDSERLRPGPTSSVLGSMRKFITGTLRHGEPQCCQWGASSALAAGLRVGLTERVEAEVEPASADFSQRDRYKVVDKK